MKLAAVIVVVLLSLSLVSNKSVKSFQSLKAASKKGFAKHRVTTVSKQEAIDLMSKCQNPVKWRQYSEVVASLLNSFDYKINDSTEYAYGYYNFVFSDENYTYQFYVEELNERGTLIRNICEILSVTRVKSEYFNKNSPLEVRYEGNDVNPETLFI